MQCQQLLLVLVWICILLHIWWACKTWERQGASDLEYFVMQTSCSATNAWSQRGIIWKSSPKIFILKRWAPSLLTCSWSFKIMRPFTKILLTFVACREAIFASRICPMVPFQLLSYHRWPALCSARRRILSSRKIRTGSQNHALILQLMLLFT